MKRLMARLGKILRTAFLLGILALLLPRLLTALHSHSKRYTVDDVPSRAVAIVFGAGLWWNGQPTPVLRDRVATAAELYHAGKVTWLLMSGSQSGSYNEPQAMHDHAISLGVPEEAIVLDVAGDRTYDTCFRARATYGIQSAILITQKFHLPRALYTCDQLGIEAVGVAADRRTYRSTALLYWNLRELPATLTAFLDIHLLHPIPVINDPTRIHPIPRMD
jgi:SanA protein